MERFLGTVKLIHVLVSYLPRPRLTIESTWTLRRPAGAVDSTALAGNNNVKLDAIVSLGRGRDDSSARFNLAVPMSIAALKSRFVLR